MLLLVSSNQKDVDDAFQKQTADLSRSHEIIMMRDFNYPYICWQTNSTKHGLFLKKKIPDNFLL